MIIIFLLMINAVFGMQNIGIQTALRQKEAMINAPQDENAMLDGGIDETMDDLDSSDFQADESLPASISSDGIEPQTGGSNVEAASALSQEIKSPQISQISAQRRRIENVASPVPIQITRSPVRARPPAVALPLSNGYGQTARPAPLPVTSGYTQTARPAPLPVTSGYTQTARPAPLPVTSGYEQTARPAPIPVTSGYEQTARPAPLPVTAGYTQTARPAPLPVTSGYTQTARPAPLPVTSGYEQTARPAPLPVTSGYEQTARPAPLPVTAGYSQQVPARFQARPAQARPVSASRNITSPVAASAY